MTQLALLETFLQKVQMQKWESGTNSADGTVGTDDSGQSWRAGTGVIASTAGTSCDNPGIS